MISTVNLVCDFFGEVCVYERELAGLLSLGRGEAEQRLAPLEGRLSTLAMGGRLALPQMRETLRAAVPEGAQRLIVEWLGERGGLHDGTMGRVRTFYHDCPDWMLALHQPGAEKVQWLVFFARALHHKLREAVREVVKTKALDGLQSHYESHICRLAGVERGSLTASLLFGDEQPHAGGNAQGQTQRHAGRPRKGEAGLTQLEQLFLAIALLPWGGGGLVDGNGWIENGKASELSRHLAGRFSGSEESFRRVIKKAMDMTSAEYNRQLDKALAMVKSTWRTPGQDG